MEPRVAAVYAAIVVADQADARGRALALADQGGAPAAARAMMALEEIATGPRMVVLGPNADDVEAQVNAPGWELLHNEHWREGPVYGACMAMERLPLVDAFFLWVLDGQPATTDEETLERMTETYLVARRKLGRIVTPVVNGKRHWPWLIDIGFRQPFIELRKGADFERVLKANAGQVVDVV
ncbi:MAG: NTP transferase domain-containing protein [Planctomycetes bacterium]|nr:NTP transferase domain-containing protein [Planctomycetota bacterium]NUQ34533.1 NTP transferase domain-containing protein [Planctomycetaceae bacterium]